MLYKIMTIIYFTLLFLFSLKSLEAMKTDREEPSMDKQKAPSSQNTPSLQTGSLQDEHIKKRLTRIHEEGSQAQDDYQKLLREGHIQMPLRRAELFPELGGESFTDIQKPGTKHIAYDLRNPQLTQEFNRNVLLSYPLYFNVDHIPNARIGAFLWTTDQKKHPHLLFAKNVKSEEINKSECFTDLGGGLALREGRPENWLEAAQRVIREQTGGAYSPGTQELLSQSLTYFRQSTVQRQFGMIFMAASYLPPRDLQHAVRENRSQFPMEKEEFIWISVPSILETLPQIERKIEEKIQSKALGETFLDWEGLEEMDGQKVNLKVRAYVPEVLRDKETRAILTRLLEVSNL